MESKRYFCTGDCTRAALAGRVRYMWESMVRGLVRSKSTCIKYGSALAAYDAALELERQSLSMGLECILEHWSEGEYNVYIHERTKLHRNLTIVCARWDK